MSSDPITFHYQGSRLIAVPSVHFKYVFASEVNRICRNPAIRPQVIAVELGPQTAEAAACWLKELYVDQGNRKNLPVMLGLAIRNRMIRASLKKRAFKLQKEMGKDLSELSPEILHRELGYAGYGTLCLSPTDSIIEAIRCALELDVPLYGVDLEEKADGDRESAVIQDPTGADANLATYIAQSAPYAAYPHDQEVDTRREIAMAARVKTLLKEYECVLFICGLGHWIHVLKLLKNPSIRPAILEDTSGMTKSNFKRVVVHPEIAIKHMGLFPALVTEYQKARKPAYKSNESSNASVSLDPYNIFENIMQRAYRDYFCAEGDSQDFSRRSQNLNSLGAFEGYLEKLCLVNLRLIPDLFMIIKAAQDTMSKGFVQAIANTIMDFPWASIEEHPECSLMAEFSGNGDDSIYKLYGKNELGDGEYFYVRTIGANGRFNSKVKIPFIWKKADINNRKSIDSGVIHTWIPWDYLISAMSLRGTGLAKKWEHEKRVELFEGSLLQGIAVKETLRSYSRGEDRLYVYDTVRKKRPNNFSFTGNGFPVVFILEPGEHSGSELVALYVECSWMEKYVQGRERFKDVVERRGHKMISLIGYGDLSIETEISKKNPSIRTDRYYGITIYQPDCWNMEQFARWMEMTDYKRNAFCNSNFLNEDLHSDLSMFLEKEHGIRIGEFEWSTTLMLLAIPFAKDFVTVVIPDNYQIPPVVFKRAKRNDVEVCTVPLSSFTREEKERLSFNHMAPAKKHDPMYLFDSSVEKAMGELQTDYRNLVPKSCLNFGK